MDSSKILPLTVKIVKSGRPVRQLGRRAFLGASIALFGLLHPLTARSQAISFTCDSGFNAAAYAVGIVGAGSDYQDVRNFINCDVSDGFSFRSDSGWATGLGVARLSNYWTISDGRFIFHGDGEASVSTRAEAYCDDLLWTNSSATALASAYSNWIIQLNTNHAFAFFGHTGPIFDSGSFDLRNETTGVEVFSSGAPLAPTAALGVLEPALYTLRARTGTLYANIVASCPDSKGPNVEYGDASFTLTLTLKEAASSACGDAIVEGAEQCDDGNLTSGDGCSSTCGDEVPEPGLALMTGCGLLALAAMGQRRGFPHSDDSEGPAVSISKGPFWRARSNPS